MADTRHWGFHAGRQLDVDVLIVDEASMVHLEMMAALRELRRHRLAGHAQRIVQRVSALAQHTVMLRESRRFGGPIGQLARAVNAGHPAQAQALLDAGTQGGTHSELLQRPGIQRIAG